MVSALKFLSCFIFSSLRSNFLLFLVLEPAFMEKEPESTKNKSVQPCRTVSTALTAVSAGFQSRWSRGTAFQVCPMTPRGGAQPLWMPAPLSVGTTGVVLETPPGSCWRGQSQTQRDQGGNFRHPPFYSRNSKLPQRRCATVWQRGAARGCIKEGSQGE